LPVFHAFGNLKPGFSEGELSTASESDAESFLRAHLSKQFLHSHRLEGAFRSQDGQTAPVGSPTAGAKLMQKAFTQQGRPVSATSADPGPLRA